LKYNFKNVIAIGAHPDDIEIGCGGSLSKWKSEGVDVTCIIMSCENEIRLNETYKAMDVLGIPKQSIVIADFKDGCIPHNKEAVSLIDKYVNKYSLIITHNENDSHQDHRNTSLCAMSAGRKSLSFLQWTTVPFPRINTYENTKPSMYVTIDNYLNTKISAIKCHKSQLLRFSKNWIKLLKNESYNNGVNSNSNFSESFYLKKFTI
jgi:LmbE family N-acetylglucosaminyl deacetylase